MRIDGPYFDDFRVGETLPPAPPITIGVGETALYQSIAGDPYALALSRPLVHAVTGDPTADKRSMKKIDDRHYHLVSTKDGKTTNTGDVVYSADMKVRTLTVHFTDPKGKKVTSVTVYDRQ